MLKSTHHNHKSKYFFRTNAGLFASYREEALWEENEMGRLYLPAVFLVSLVLILSLPVSTLHATVVYPLEIFTDNGSYYASSDVDLHVEVADRDSQVDFTFHNESLIDCTIATIYFQSGPFLSSPVIIEGPGTSFDGYPTPHNLPAGKLLEPSFVATYELSMGSDKPAPQNGINPGEWIIATFDLINDGTFLNVIDDLNREALRIGAHVIGLPDGSSESAIIIPEPSTLSLLCLCAFVLFRKRRI